MMQMTVLASGSKGNSTVISSSKTRVLVDAGLSCRELMKRMATVGEDPAKLDAILITHEHQDHVSGLGVLARKLGIPVYFTEPTHRAWVRMMKPRTTMSYAQWLAHVQQEKEARAQAVAASSASEPGICDSMSAAVEAPSAQTLCEEPDEPEAAAPKSKADPASLPAVEYFHSGRQFVIGDIEITPFTIPHDAADPCGFVFSSEGIRMAIATDLGYMPPNVKAALKRIDVLLIESNHDLEMLKDGPYPWSVKQRVLSRVGHLSNLAMAEFLERDYDGSAAYVVLGHLSESNNAPELARMTAEQAMMSHPTLLGNRIVLAEQAAPLDPIYL
ncbi:MBL fold metallo-hydrolase [Edaphobacter sp. 12200R-103]|jgi:phosphoribosyl 1,2-cyclic phosphodiesterase|uniref:MBL fold metallo-hydrolase n=1 Tax=Edaphobacter sp. 12200R-103 TaxID=2703788 RepID=UPI00138C34D8|nr:MBL fold metallo-hydrolase [Edaphobacter sp. 12200R-103]QHS52091.1 MBL fold metallo-hydrolase [Edaphobacter sp. 12200R-103]